MENTGRKCWGHRDPVLSVSVLVITVLPGTFASGSRDSQHHGYFQRFLHLGTTDKEIPEVPS